MTNKTLPLERAITYHDYVAAIGQGEAVSRQDMAKRMQVTYSTALYHLERAVSARELYKAYGFIDRQPGWLYCKPQDAPKQESV